VPTPETVPAMQGVIGYPRGPWVVKPRYGAGSQETYLLTDHPIAAVRVPGDSPFGEPLVQRFIPGRPASVAFLIGPRQTVALAPAWQDLSDDDRFHYRGGSIPIPPDLAARAERVARRAVAAVPGLGGSVSVDVVLGDAEDVVIEINSRLTTSYVGLRALAADNLMGLLLRLTRGEPGASNPVRDASKMRSERFPEAPRT
jgi:predicted ATP-grasp superfamily ATP-dependent carboligase